MLKCEKYSYELQPDTDTGFTLKLFLSREMGVDIEDQTIIFADNFQTLNDEQLLVDQCRRNVQEVIFFDTKPRHNYITNESPMPDKVRELVGNPCDRKKYTELRPLWAQALYYCQSKANEYALLLKSRIALTKSIEVRWGILQKQKANLEKEVTKLDSFVEMFKLSYDYDLMNRPEEFEGGHKCLTEWKILYERVDNFTAYKNLNKLYEKLESKGEMIKCLKISHHNPLDEE